MPLNPSALEPVASPTPAARLPQLAGSPAAAVQRDMTIEDLFAILSRRRSTILTVFCIFLALVATAFVFSTRLYKASAVIQVQKGSADALSLGTMMGTDEAPGDALESNITLQTQAQILMSSELALQVVQELHLESSPDFRSHFNPINWVLGKLSPKGIPDPAHADLMHSPARRDHIVRAFEARLKIKPVAGTRLIEITYLSTSPATAAAVVNQLVTDLVDFNFSTRQAATEKADEWLTRQLADLKTQMAEKQAEVVALQQSSGVFSVGKTDSQGQEQLYTPELDELQKATEDLSDAQAAVILKGSLYQVVKDGDPELISGLDGNGLMSAASSGLAGSLTLLQGLRTQQAQTAAQLAELSQKFGPAYPKLAEMEANLASIRQAIQAETGRIAARAKNDYDIARSVEARDQALFDQERTQAVALNGKEMAYQIAREEADQSRTLYESLLQRMREADLVAGLRSSNITVVTPARPTARPAKPAILIYLAAGILGGAVLGICLGLLRDATDRRIMDVTELGLPATASLIGFLPFHRGMTKAFEERSRRSGKGLLLTGPDAPSAGPAQMPTPAMIAAADPRSVYTEALRALRTTLMRISPDGPPQVMLVTSSVPGEGKSLISINLAIIHAQRGKTVLLVDGDLRTPTIGMRLELPPGPGLAELLTAPVPGSEPRPVTVELPNNARMDVLTAGASPGYPAELLGSEQMQALLDTWRSRYDYIVIDGAPLLPVTDSALLSHLADYTLLVARHQMTDRRSIEWSWSILQAQGVDRAGIVLNGIKAAHGAQYTYYGHIYSSTYGKTSHA